MPAAGTASPVKLMPYPFVLALAIVAIVATFIPRATAQGAGPARAPGVTRGQSTGLPVPRYVSLKSDRVHVRQGPGTDYKVLWVFQRVGLPVEVVREFEGWREIRDSEGATGWVLQSLLSGRRSGLVVNWDVKRSRATAPHQRLPIRSSARDSGETVAMVEPGVIANVLSCDGTWCRISIGAVNGHIRQNQLWGVYEGETLR